MEYRISGENIIYVNFSGYTHVPYVVTFVNAYEECGAELMTHEQIQEKYNIYI